MTDARRTIETPWGIDIQATVQTDGAGVETLAYSYTATAYLHGIHAPERRACFVLDAQDAAEAGGGQGAIDELIIKYGGRLAPRIVMTPPERPLYPILRKQLRKPALSALDGWCDRIADRPGWRQRAPELLTMLDGMMIAGSKPGPAHCEEPCVMGAHIARTLTAILEHLGEQRIDGIEQAAFYALSEHPKWRAAGRDWAAECRVTWWRDWIKARPVYRHAARLANLHHSVPHWFWRW